jgi:hypothetical protein
MDLQDLKFEFRLTNDGDDWGHVLTWLFAVAEEIYFERDFPVPDKWKFKPSIFGKTIDEADYCSVIVCQADDESLLAFGKILDRAAQCLRAHGKDY